MHKDNTLFIKGFVNHFGILIDENTQKEYHLANRTTFPDELDYGFFMLRPDTFWKDKWYCTRKIILKTTKIH